VTEVGREARPMSAHNFDEFVIAMAEEAPQAVVLDWYRRLEMAIRTYLASRQLRHRTGPDAETVLASDPSLGIEVARRVSELRVTRNQVAHDCRQPTPVQAVAFARQALSLIGRIWIAQDARPPNVR
jgi:hypothetical protein